MGVADRTLKTFDYISKGLLPSDDARIREESGRTNTGLLFREEKATRGRQPDGFEGTGVRGWGISSRKPWTSSLLSRSSVTTRESSTVSYTFSPAFRKVAPTSQYSLLPRLSFHHFLLPSSRSPFPLSKSLSSEWKLSKRKEARGGGNGNRGMEIGG